MTGERTLDGAFVDLVESRALMHLIETAKAEDLASTGDVTSRLMIDADATATATMAARGNGVWCGAKLLGLIAKQYDQRLRVQLAKRDGDALVPGDTVATVDGPLRSLLAAERVMLNFATHLSGIATTTRRYVDAVAGTPAKIYDTRKTVPGLRALAKYAVRCGGGQSHRIGLHDAVLVKDNHIAGASGEDLRDRLMAMVAQARALPHVKFIEVEVDALEQLSVVLTCGVDVVLLDNMGACELANAVAMRDADAPGVQLEASGGITLATVGQVAATGVDRIAIGALTHSAPALDLGLDMACHD